MVLPFIQYPFHNTCPGRLSKIAKNRPICKPNKGLLLILLGEQKRVRESARHSAFFEGNTV